MQLRLYLLAGMFSLAGSTYAQQQQPVTWTYSTKLIGKQVYEIHITASIDAGWHIYSQHQPSEAIAVPTSITYTQNPLIAIQGPTKEEGKVVHFRNDTIGIAQDQYSKKVDFVQVVRLKAAVKTKVQGNLTFQACTDEQCLPAAHINFSIELTPSGEGAM